MKKISLLFSLVFVLGVTTAFAQPDATMPSEPGKCYAKCLIQDQYEVVTQQVMVKEPSSSISVVPASFETATNQMVATEAGNSISVVPATFKTATKSVMVKPAHKVMTVVPATFETVTEQFLVKEAYDVVTVVPAVYETATEQVMTMDAYSKIERMPATMESVTEQIMVAEASTKWIKKKADKNCLSTDPNDCLVWCLVEVPASYKSVTKTVNRGCTEGWTQQGDDCMRTIQVPAAYTTRSYQALVSPATTVVENVPAAYETRSYQQLKTPAMVTETEVPAVYKDKAYQALDVQAAAVDSKVDVVMTTVSHQALSADATIATTEMDAVYKTITKRSLVKPGGFTEWREIVCETDITVELVRSVQRALMSRGYDVGSPGADNILGRYTKAALVQFQKDNGLPVGQLDFESLRALGVK